MIPKQVFLFWSGRAMSWLRYLTIRSLRAHNPDWTIVLYLCSHPQAGRTKPWSTNEKQDFFKYDGPDHSRDAYDLVDRIENWQARLGDQSNPVAESDVFQWSIVSECGGYYSDMDILWIAPLDRIHAEHGSSDAVFCFGNWELTIGFFGANRGCQIVRRAAIHAKRIFDPAKYQSCGSEALAKAIGYDLLIQHQSAGNKDKGLGKRIRRSAVRYAIRRNFPDQKVAYLDGNTIYPWLWHNAVNIFRNSLHTVPDETIGIHWYAGATWSQKYNNCTKLAKLHLHNSVLTREIRKLLDMAV